MLHYGLQEQPAVLLELVHGEWAAMLMACIGNHRYEQVGWELVGVLSEIAWYSRCSRFGYGLEVFLLFSGLQSCPLCISGPLCMEHKT